MSVFGVGPIRFENVSAVTLVPSVEVGTRVDVGDERYRYVYNAGNSAIAPGKMVTCSLVTGHSVTVSTTTMIDMNVGIVKHATITTGAYGWVMENGFSKFIAHADESFAAGSLITPAADGLAGQKTISTGFIGTVCGKAMEAIASAGSGQGYFRFF